MVYAQASRQRGSTLLALVAILVVVLAAGVGVWTWRHGSKQANSGKSTLVAASTPDCSSLSLSKGTSEGAAGTMYTHAIVTNTGSVACKITGYPSVFLLDSGGAALGSGAAANSLYSPTAVTLAPGGQAHSVLGFPNAGNFDARVCSAVSTSLQLYVPGLATALTVAWADHSCPGFSATAFTSGA